MKDTKDLWIENTEKWISGIKKLGNKFHDKELLEMAKRREKELEEVKVGTLKIWETTQY